jgi:thermitase
MKARWLAGLLLAVFIVSLATPVAAGQGDKIVRTRSGLDGLTVVNSVCRFLGCQVLGSLDLLPGQTGPSSLFLVRGLLDNTVNWLLSLFGLATIEPDLPVALAATDDWTPDQASAAVVNDLWDRTPTTYYGTSAWDPYLRQPANDIVRLRETHCQLRATGGVIVAVIDTGVDATHPTLKAVLMPGYDFTRNSADTGETTGCDQASAAVVNDYGVEWVNPVTAATVDQASAAVVNDPDHKAFGHGTMVAGVVHLAAPTARIMPLKAFGADGQGYTSDILRAINYATQKGAKVLNMSFSRPTSSPELKSAIDNATKKGLIAISSAGNDGKAMLVYPAAYDNVIGVASTTNDDTRSSFSNYGAKLVTLAAPGQGIITPYPGGGFAAAWGTSFSTPYVSGVAALLAGVNGSATPSQVRSALSNAKGLTSDLGYGRLDAYRAVQAGRAMWPWGASSAVPESCESDNVDWSAVP